MTNPDSRSPLDDPLLRRIRAEFLETAGLSPTLSEAARLFQLSPEECGRVLCHLVEQGFLRQGRRGRYCVRSAAA
jgi:DNA-binding IclR family transcriptional regulator